MELVWSPAAVDDLNAAADYIESDLRDQMACGFAKSKPLFHFLEMYRGSSNIYLTAIRSMHFSTAIRGVLPCLRCS